MNCTQEEIKKASAILQFRKLILTKISNDRLVIRIKGRSFFTGRTNGRGTWKRRNYQLKIGLSYFIKNVLMQSVFACGPGTTKLLAAGSNQARRRERNEGGEDGKVGDEDTQA